MSERKAIEIIDWGRTQGWTDQQCLTAVAQYEHEQRVRAENARRKKEYEEKFLMEILQKDLQGSIDGADDLCKDLKISDEAKILIIEMVFQLGKTGVSKFRNMWKALQEDPPNYFEAHVQMLDSQWAKQTPARATEMAEQMQKCV